LLPAVVLDGAGGVLDSDAAGLEFVGHSGLLPPFVVGVGAAQIWLAFKDACLDSCFRRNDGGAGMTVGMEGQE
ncbi:MAG: hypothetical protein J4N88_09290, partial [Chloroflexi bacterium]|nr:hypothetical protein [Chloroflexota bacterium]